MKVTSLFCDMLAADGALLDGLIQRAVRMKQEPEKYREAARGKLMYALYQKTSTRTHLSFARAMLDLGGQYISQSWESSNFAIGDFQYEVRYVATTADLLMARLISNDDIMRMGEYSSIPVINGCCNKFHPMQALADCLTMYELFHKWSDVRCVYVGVLNNVANSLMASLPRLGAELVAVCPEVNPQAVRDDLIAEARATGRFELIQDGGQPALRRAIANANVVYTDTWVDMEMLAGGKSKELEERAQRMQEFQLNPENLGSSNAYIMHCMPVHSGYEIAASLVHHERSRIYQQAANRASAQKSAICYVLENA